MKTQEKSEKQLELLAAHAFKIKKTIYNDAISCKFDNRRVTVIKQDNGFGFEFKAIDHDYTPHAHCECVRGKVAVTYINLSKEAAEIVMLNLAELMGFRICR